MFNEMGRAGRAGRALSRAVVIVATWSLIGAASALAGEITDENEELEKIVWGVDAESERDPELSVGGETVQVEPGDLITFRIAINEDAVEEDDDGIAMVDDVFKKADLEFVTGDAEFDPEDCDPPAEASAPADNKVACRVALGPDGNARLYLTFRVLPPSGNPQACVPGTNVVNTDGASSAAEGADQAQYEICPEGTLAGTLAGAGGETQAGADDAGAGGMPNTATEPPGSSATAVVMLLIAVIVTHALVRSMRTR